jgi:hypothetical protein
VRPTIVGPAAWPALGPPPSFTVDTAGRALYLVELAAARCLMTRLAHRTCDNYFFGGDAESVFATGPGWCVPARAWARLRGARLLFYRVVAFDQAACTSQMSVDDQNIDRLPSMVVTGGPPRAVGDGP